MKRTISTKDLVFTAMIGALYSALCMALAPLSYGMVQVRAAEALTLLPIFSSVGVWGLTLGCAVSNFVGFMTGANILGYLDIFFGTAASLLAAILSRMLRNKRIMGIPVLSALPPIIINAIVVGAELAIVTGTQESFMAAFISNALFVALGQTAAVIGMGLPLTILLEKSGAAEKCFGPQDIYSKTIRKAKHF